MRNKISQQIKSFQVKCFFITRFFTYMSNGITLITLFSLSMMGHFNPMGINSSDIFSLPMGAMGALQVFFFFWPPMGVTSNDFFFIPMGGCFKGFFISKSQVLTFPPFSCQGHHLEFFVIMATQGFLGFYSVITQGSFIELYFNMQQLNEFQLEIVTH